MGIKGQDGFDDALQIGMMGLMKAAATFDSDKAAFSTYAGRCVENELRTVRRKNFNRDKYIVASLDEPMQHMDGNVALLECLATCEITAEDAVIESERNSEIMGIAYLGESYGFLGENADWYHIAFGNEKGWITKKYTGRA